jgi:hypothetical protein
MCPLFININTAQYALENGLFKIERVVPERKGRRKEKKR